MGQLNNNLPLELVEKMMPHVDLYKTKRDRAEQCAQIAVDYAKEEVEVFRHVILGQDRIHDRLQEENRVFREQRGELITALKGSTEAIKWYMEYCKPDNDDYTTFFNLGMNQQTENEQLLKKHNDGK